MKHEFQQVICNISFILKENGVPIKRRNMKQQIHKIKFRCNFSAFYVHFLNEDDTGNTRIILKGLFVMVGA